jgi:hypothetical protein
MNKADCKVGMKVFFGRERGQKTLGEIVKVNRTRAKVRTLEVRGHRAAAKAGEVWTVPFSMLTEAGTDATPGTPPPAKPKRSHSEIIEDLKRVEFNLEPEVLYQDGERPRAQAQRIGRRLQAERNALVRELGREPTSQELWGTWAR